MGKPPNSRIANNYVSFINKGWKNSSRMELIARTTDPLPESSKFPKWIESDLDPYFNVKNWLESKRDDDNAEGLWRVHDSLYDLTKFVNLHPGGSDWLIFTKGTDITEAFETHHLNMKKTSTILAKYEVRKASQPRNIKLTFHEDGFYQTLKRRVVTKLSETHTKSRLLSDIYTDTLLVGTFIASILSTRFSWFSIFASLFMTWVVIAAHNYFHRKDNFRMRYFNLSFMNYREWRVSHALSHHMYTNSLVDMEVMWLEPLFRWIPDPAGKNIINRYISWAYGPLVYAMFFIVDFVKRIVALLTIEESKFSLSDLIPFTLPVAMYLLGEGSNVGIFVVIKMWLIIVCLSSFMFALTGLNAGHHHPEVFHDGDAIRDNLDWGAYQLDTMIDREDLKGNHFLVLTNFGDHILHHLFPTLDHGQLRSLYSVLRETLLEFQLNARVRPWTTLIIGQHQQLARITPNDRCLRK